MGNGKTYLSGLMLLDNSMSGGLRSTYMSVSGTYHKGLSEQHRHGIGFQSTYGNRIIDFSRLTFNNQFATDGFDTNLPSGESVLFSIKPTNCVIFFWYYRFELHATIFILPLQQSRPSGYMMFVRW